MLGQDVRPPAQAPNNGVYVHYGFNIAAVWGLFLQKLLVVYDRNLGLLERFPFACNPSLQLMLVFTILDLFLMLHIR